MAQKTVLIVEDEEPIADALVFLVEEAGHRAVAARNGQAALELVAQKRPDLVITDLMMPRMSGAELITALRANGHGDLPVVLLTAAGRDAIAGIPANAYLGKPFDFSEVEALLHRYLDSE